MTRRVICPYCGSTAEFVNSAKVYGGRDFGMIYCCPNFPICDSYVGVHKGTETPLGRMANAELRNWKQKAHAAFDPLWKRKIEIMREQYGRYAKFTARRDAYQWLAGKLDLPAEKCHIAMFDVETCKRVVDLCRPYYQQPTEKGTAA